MAKDVVVTGMGVVSSLGIGKDRFWKNLIKATSGIRKVTLFDTSRYRRHYGGEVTNFDVGKFIPSDFARFLGRASQFAIVSTKLAMEDAGISFDNLRRARTAVIVGTTMAEAAALDISCEKFLKNRWDEITKRLILNVFPTSVARNIGYFFRLHGLNFLLPNACAAGNYAIGYGFDLIRQGEVDVAIVGGAEALSRVAFQGFQRLYAMAPRVCRPFDKNRKGMLLGEGAAILILESGERVRERKARGYSKVLGYGLSSDAHHMTIPKKEGVAKSMIKALKNAGITTHDVDYISAHGTGTIQNDKIESAAIKDVFGRRAHTLPISSIKSMLGHCMGAASALEAVACYMALQEGVIPPTKNFVTPDPECDIDCVPNKARKQKVNVVLNNGFAFGGNNCCVVFGTAYSGDRVSLKTVR